MNINSLSGQNPINSPNTENTQQDPPGLSSEKEALTTPPNTNNINSESVESKTQSNNLSANMLKMSLLAKVPTNNQQPNTTPTNTSLPNKLNEIKGSSLNQDKNYPLTLSLPKNDKGQPTEVNKLNAEDYENTFIKETLRQVGINNATDSEVKLFQEQYKNATGKDFNLKNPLTELRSNTINGKLEVKVSQYDLAVAKTVGNETIIAERQSKSQIAEQAYSDGTKYVDDLMKGYIAARVNAPINLINGLTEPVRGVAAMGGVDLSGLTIPRLEVAKESEYWNKGNRIADEEFGATLGLGTAVGGAINQQLLSNPVGRAVVGIESSYNIGIGAAGVDPTTKNADGTYRELSIAERAFRIGGGILGGRSLSKAEPLPPTPNKSSTPTLPFDPTAPAVVTPDGRTFNWRMPTEPTFKPATPGTPSNVSRPNSFTPGYAVSSFRETPSSNGFGGPLGRPDPIEAKNHLVIDLTPEGQAKQVKDLRESLSTGAQKIFDDEYKTAVSNQQFLQRIGNSGDPAKMYEARAKRVSTEGVEASNQARLVAETRFNQAKLQLDNPTFLNKQQVKDAIAERDPNKLRSEIAVELARQEAELKYPRSDGYKTLTEVKLLKEIPGFSTKKEWQFANPGKPSNHIFEKDGKVYQPATDIDLVVVKPNPKNGLSEIVYLEQIKSGHNDQFVKGKAQMDKSVDVLKRIASGDPSFVINEKRTTYDYTTKEYDLSNIDKVKTVVRGPERRDSGFDKSVGLSTDEMNSLSKQIIKGKNP